MLGRWGDYTKSESSQWKPDLDCCESMNSEREKANPPMQRWSQWSVANGMRRGQVPHVHTVGQDRELQDELSIEENDHDRGMASVSAFKVFIYIQHV